MTSITTNLMAQNVLGALRVSDSSLTQSLQRLASGYRIHSSRDDPSGVVGSNSLQAQMAGMNAAIENIQSADSLLATASGSLNEVSSLLTSLQSVVVTAANASGLTSDEKDANQAQVDSILATLNRLTNSSSYNGMKLLTGQLGYTLSGPTTSTFSNVKIFSAHLPSTGGTVSVTIAVVASANTGTLKFLASARTVGTASGIQSALTLSFTGARGSETISLAQYAKAPTIAAAINLYTAQTGISATTSGGSGVVLKSTSYGSEAFVTVASSSTTAFLVKNTSGSTASSSTGRDATLRVNGATIYGSGLNAHAVIGDLDLSVTLHSSTATNVTGFSKTFGITGGGARFQLSADAGASGQADVGIFQVNTSTIGKVTSGNSLYTLADLLSGGRLATNNGTPNLTLAQDVLTQSIQDVSQLQGKIGAFQSNTLQSLKSTLEVTMENIQAAHSALYDTDFAAETSRMTRAQVLRQSGIYALTVANTRAQTLLRLLGIGSSS